MKCHSPRLNEIITATNHEESYGTGDLVSTQSTFQFWGKIKDIKTDTKEGGGKRRDVRTIEIMSRHRDVGNVSNNTELSIDATNETFVVQDKYDTKWKNYTGILATAITN